MTSNRSSAQRAFAVVLNFAALLAIPVMLMALWKGTAGWRADLQARQGQRERAALHDSIVGTFRQNSVLGTRDGNPVLLEFMDYECPACRSSAESIDGALETNPGAGLLVLHYPLRQIHPNAEFAARMSVCAEQQGAFQKIHPFLLRTKAIRDTLVLTNVVTDSLRLDGKALSMCMASGLPKARLARDHALGVRFRIPGTPTFVTPDGRVVGVAAAIAVLTDSG